MTIVAIHLTSLETRKRSRWLLSIFENQNALICKVGRANCAKAFHEMDKIEKTR